MDNDKLYYVCCWEYKTSETPEVLLGPFDTQEEAVESVELGMLLVKHVDSCASWYSYGTMSTKVSDTQPRVVFQKQDNESYTCQTRVSFRKANAVGDVEVTCVFNEGKE